MKAMAISAYGSELRMIELPEPIPGRGQVRIRVRASSVNPADCKVISGEVKILHGGGFPIVMGYDFAGEIDLPAGDLKTGERVFGFLPYRPWNQQGAFAEKIVAPIGSIARIPERVSFEQAASCATVALTAWDAIRGGVSKRVLINGASGGVGSFAVQLAKTQGASVTAICSADSAEFTRSLGADEVLDYRKVRVPEIQVCFDLLFDVASNLSFFEVRRLLTAGGRYVTLLPGASAIAGAIISPFLRQKCGFVAVKPVRQDLERIVAWIAEGRLRTPIERSYPLDQVGEAIHRLEQGKVRGKLTVSLP